MIFWNEISDELKDLPDANYTGGGHLKVNAHIHSPYSFSSFDSVDSIINTAVKENISVLGINDFNTVDGYAEWSEKCYSADIFPLFGIEMIGLDWGQMKKGSRVNDPNNPGRTYISGKALAFPSRLSEASVNKLKRIRELSNKHVERMTRKVNGILYDIDNDLRIDFRRMLDDYTMGMVRERHLAGMVRIIIEEAYSEKKRRDEVLTAILGADFDSVSTDNHARLENLIRSKLLKSGGAAFVEEDPEIFIEPAEIRELILDAGGIPTYPFLADFNKGMYTDFEKDREKAASSLKERGFYSAEFIPSRNDFHRLRDYVMYLYDRDFIITFGTEHNSPGTKPLEVKAAGDHILNDDLLRINFEGACILAAHQYKSAIEGQGYLDEKGRPKTGERTEFISLGNRIIKTVCS